MDIKFISNIGVPFVILTLFTFWNWKEGGVGAVAFGAQITYKMVMGILIVLAISFLIAGQATAIITRHSADIVPFLKGKHGIWGSVGAGIVMPSMGSFPVVTDLWNRGILSYGSLALILLATRLINFQTVLFFMPFLGWQLTLISVGIGGAVILLAVLVTKIFQL
jgi:hypothetical protein